MIEILRRKRENLQYASITYRDFSNIMDKKVVKINQSKYQEYYNGTDTETIAILLGMPRVGSVVDFTDTDVLVNEDKFKRVSKRYQNIMIQTVVVHEKIECWERLCHFDEICTPIANGKPHQIALLHEYSFIHGHGLACEYLDFLQQCSSVMESQVAASFIEENVNAYHEVVSNGWRPDPRYHTNKLVDLRSIK